MSTHLSGRSVGWADAIRHAELQLETAGRERALLLEGVIAVFRDKMESGEPWPGSGYTVTHQSDVEIVSNHK